jgi:hypothetical protein
MSWHVLWLSARRPKRGRISTIARLLLIRVVRGTFSSQACCIAMSNTEQKASKGMIKFVLTIFVIAIILALAYMTFFTPGEVRPSPKLPTTSQGGN